MAPVAEGVSDWTLIGSSSLEVCTTSLLLLVTLITLLAICIRCHRKTDAQTKSESAKTKSQNGTSTSQKTSNGTSVKGQEGVYGSQWKDHKSMPEVPDIPSRIRNTLPRTPASDPDL
ncbi:uncharacterized protein [Osmerus mordax]|uniref:uncharacterized protein n=1 Tax=Osmerus mordax TaxID=8014 RepID=UPI00351006A7